jgi:hypothetical protein
MPISNQYIEPINNWRRDIGSLVQVSEPRSRRFKLNWAICSLIDCETGKVTEHIQSSVLMENSTKLKKAIYLLHLYANFGMPKQAMHRVVRLDLLSSYHVDG